MKNKFLSYAMSALFVGGVLGGCTAPALSGSSAESTAQSISQSSSTPAEPVTITLWHSMSDETGILMEKLVSDFNNGVGQEKGITVESVFQGSYSDSTAKLRTILQNDQRDQLPDIMQIDATGMVDYQATEYKYTVDDALKSDSGYDMDQFLEVPLKNWNYNGVQLGMPFSSSTTIMYYNKTMLDAAGITQAPATFAEITAASAKLPKQTPDGKDVYAYAAVPNTATLANWIGQIPGNGLSASYVVENRNGRSSAVTKLVCDTEGTLSTFLTEWKSMFDAKALLNSSESLSDLFMAGQIALFTGSSSNLNTLLTTIGDKFELGCAYLPRVNAEANDGATVSGSGMFLFDKGAEAQRSAAWEFEKFLVSADVQAEFSIGTGYFPANDASFDTEAYKAYVAKNPQLEVSINQVNATSVDMLGVTIGPSWDFYMEIQNQISAGLESGTSVDEMVSSLSDSLKGILEQYNKSNS